MQEWQKDIYFIAGESLDSVKKSPFLEVANKKQIEVIYLTEPVDEYTFQHLAEFDGHKLQSLSKEGLKFGDEDEEVIKKRAKAYKESFKPLTKYLKDLFSGKVAKVAVSQRVDKSPAVVVTSQYGHTANMERIMRAQTFASGENLRAMAATRTLELNPRHPICIALNKLVTADPDAETTKDLAYHLFDTALLNSGFTQDDLEGFSDRMYRTMASALKVSSMDLADEMAVGSEEEEEEEAKDKDSSSSSSSSSEASHDGAEL
jgi:heat shock protein beta